MWQTSPDWKVGRWDKTTQLNSELAASAEIVVFRIGLTTRHAGAAVGILQGPFKDNRYGLCWAGVLIGRRLVLILLYTFVNDALVRLLAMLLFCFVVLLHHVDVQPYRHRVGNIAGTFSATALVTLGTVNLVRYVQRFTPTTYSS